MPIPQASISFLHQRADRRPELVALLMCVVIFLPSAARGASCLDVQPIANPAGVRIGVRPTSRAGWGLLQVVDAKTGAVLQTIYAGRIPAAEHFAVVKGPALPAGSYKLQYREGIELVLDADIKRPDPKLPEWQNPTDLSLAGNSVYVRDAGTLIPPSVPEKAAERNLKQPCIIKMARDGKLDTTFAQGGLLPLPDQYQYRALAADPADGRLYIGSGSHEVRVIEPSGTSAKQVIGGWDNNPAGPKCLAWCDSLALGPDNRIYITLGGYGNGKTYDRTKNAFDGWIYRWDVPDVNGTARLMCSDMQGSMYYCGQTQQITRHVDDGKSLLPVYRTPPEAKLSHPCGGSASAGLTWWACHGPGFGPFWDSGGGGEVVLFWDTGKEMKLIDRFGVPGTSKEGIEFLNPSASIMNPAHNELWVVEDGQPNTEGPKGNARVRRFALKARYREEVKIDLPG